MPAYAKPDDPLCSVASPDELLWLSNLCKANSYMAPTPMGNGEYACLSRFAFTCAILKGTMFDDYGYEDRWCFDSFPKALHALSEWMAASFEGEPQGWHRHPDTGRRREGGDPSKEIIAP